MALTSAGRIRLCNCGRRFLTVFLYMYAFAGRHGGGGILVSGWYRCRVRRGQLSLCHCEYITSLSSQNTRIDTIIFISSSSLYCLKTTKKMKLALSTRSVLAVLSAKCKLLTV